MHNGQDFGYGAYGGGSDNEDVIEVEFLPGGILKVTTDPISGANHTNAEGLMDTIRHLAGGEHTHEPRGDHHHHQGHEHNHTHEHG